MKTFEQHTNVKFDTIFSSIDVKFDLFEYRDQLLYFYIDNFVLLYHKKEKFIMYNDDYMTNIKDFNDVIIKYLNITYDKQFGANDGLKYYIERKFNI